MTASVELDCQDMEVELVLLAWVVEELGKVVTELDELVLLAWVVEELDELVLLAWVVEELGKVVTELDKLVLLAWAIEELGEVVTEPDALLVVENGEPPGLCSYSVST